MTDSLFGKSSLTFGPANTYWDTESGGDNRYLGEVDQTTLRVSTQKIDLKTAQAGDRPADRAVSAQTVEVEQGLAQATVERMEDVQQGFSVDRDTNNVITRLHIADVVGQRDLSIAKTMTIKELDAGVETTDPAEIWDIWRAAPNSESVELLYDAVSQRYYSVMFLAYKEPNILDNLGRAVYCSSRVMFE